MTCMCGDEIHAARLAAISKFALEPVCIKCASDTPIYRAVPQSTEEDGCVDQTNVQRLSVDELDRQRIMQYHRRISRIAKNDWSGSMCFESVQGASMAQRR